MSLEKKNIVARASIAAELDCIKIAVVLPPCSVETHDSEHLGVAYFS